MEIKLKLIIDKNKQISLKIYESVEIQNLLESLITMVHFAYPLVQIKHKESCYVISKLNDDDSFNVLMAFIEEVFIRYVEH